jgi:hypothetical protein
MELLREKGVGVRVLSFPSCVLACNRDPLHFRYWDHSQTDVALYLKDSPDFNSQNYTSFQLCAFNTFFVAEYTTVRTSQAYLI